MAIPVELSKPINLNLQLSDGEESLPKVVVAILRDELGNVLAESPVTLDHIGGGLFKDVSVAMPNKEEITAQFIVYEDDGITEAEDFDRALDVFYLPKGGGSGSGSGANFCEEFVMFIDDSDI